MKDLKELFKDQIGSRKFVAIQQEDGSGRVMLVEEETTDAWFFEDEAGAKTALHLASWVFAKGWTTKVEIGKDWYDSMGNRIIQIVSHCSRTLRMLVQHEDAFLQGAQNAFLIAIERRFVEYLRDTLKDAPAHFKDMYAKLEAQVYERVIFTRLSPPGVHRYKHE